MQKPLEDRYVISEFEIATGRPLGEHANKYISHCGYLVRDQIPISAREWREKRGALEISFCLWLWQGVSLESRHKRFHLQHQRWRVEDANLWLDYEEDGGTVPELEEVFVQ